MTEKQWSTLHDVIQGKELKPIPVGFIIDSPWLPNWYGINILDYFTSDDLWFNANLKAINTFPEIIFLPGFWSEYGMCSEPASFGSISSFPLNEFPHAKKNILSIEDIGRISRPDPGRDGLTPLIINRLKLNRKRIEDSGHRIYFSVSRGPLNIASYLMGVQEFLTGMIMNPEEIHHLLDKITDFLVDWHELQRKAIPTIDGILVLDDIIGFIGEEEFKEFGLPYFKKIYDRDVSIRCFHNDADYRSSTKYLPEIGINLYNMGFDTCLNEIRNLTGGKISLMGNIPPRDVLAKGSQSDIENAVKELIGKLEDKTGVILSCGGGMPPEVPSDNIRRFVDTVNSYS
jgi:uroporphyrinogen-III decarboxylase